MRSGISTITSKDIFLLSVHHTGTVFLFDMFRTNPSLHCVELEFIITGQKHLDPNRRNVVQCHIGVDYRDRFWDWWAPWLTDRMRWKFPTVMPVRDPLLSIITRERREPERGPHSFIVDSWVRFVETMRHPSPFYVAIDRPGNYRVNTIQNMMYHCGLEPWSGVEDLARKWEPRNKTHSESKLTEAYDDGWKDHIEKALPVEMAQLRNAEPTLRPFFEDLGYRDLLWWG